MKFPNSLSKASLLFLATILFISFCGKSLFAQSPILPPSEKSSLWHSLEQSDSSGWMYFLPDDGPSMDEFWSQLAPESFKSFDSEIKLVKEETDELGITHHRFQQFYRGYPVRGADITIKSKEGKIYVIHGKWMQEMDVSSEVRIEESEALQLAIEEIGAEVYLWEDAEYIALKQKLNEDDALTFYPEGDLVIHRKYEDTHSKETQEIHRLTWYFTISSSIPNATWGIYVDAQTGEIFEKQNLRSNCDPSGGGCSTLYNGSQWILIDKESNSLYELEDCGRKIVGITGDFNQPIVQHSSASWGTAEQGSTSAYWAAQRFSDYMTSTFGNGATSIFSTFLEIRINSSLPTAYDPLNNQITVGQISGGTLEATVDIMGHEIMHGVDNLFISGPGNTPPGLSNQREPGAIQEGYCDIFGMLGERDVAINLGGTWDWTIGEDAGVIYRNMQNPLATQNPNVKWGGHYFSPSTTNCPTPNPLPFSDGGNDNCGIHRNSTLISLAFYLLSQGGSQNGGISVPAIGIDKAADIAYRALKYELQTNSGFNDTRNAWIEAAKDLYGTCSWEEFACKRAWAAVGIGSSPNSFCVIINGPTSACYDSYTFPTYTATSISGASHSWMVPSGWTVQFSGTGNKTMTVTDIAPWSYPNAYISVWTSGNGLYSSDGHSVTVYNCYQYRSTNGIVASPKIYPQPASEYVIIELSPTNLPASCVILDIMGREVQRINLIEEQQKINIQSLASGIYSCKIIREDDSVFHQKIQIKR